MRSRMFFCLVGILFVGKMFGATPSSEGEDHDRSGACHVNLAARVSDNVFASDPLDPRAVRAWLALGVTVPAMLPPSFVQRYQARQYALENVFDIKMKKLAPGCFQVSLGEGAAAVVDAFTQFRDANLSGAWDPCVLVMQETPMCKKCSDLGPTGESLLARTVPKECAFQCDVGYTTNALAKSVQARLDELRRRVWGLACPYCDQEAKELRRGYMERVFHALPRAFVMYFDGLREAYLEPFSVMVDGISYTLRSVLTGADKDSYRVVWFDADHPAHGKTIWVQWPIAGVFEVTSALASPEKAKEGFVF